MKRIVYLAIVPGNKETPASIFMDEFWHPEDKPPGTPYIKVECVLLEHEERFIGSRGEKKRDDMPSCLKCNDPWEKMAVVNKCYKGHSTCGNCSSIVGCPICAMEEDANVESDTNKK